MALFLVICVFPAAIETANGSSRLGAIVWFLLSLGLRSLSDITAGDHIERSDFKVPICCAAW